MSISTNVMVVGNAAGTLFLAYDDNSGYPHCVDSVRSAHVFRENDDDIAALLRDAKEVVDFRGVSVYELSLTKVDVNQITKKKDTDKVHQLLATLTDAQKQILIDSIGKKE